MAMKKAATKTVTKSATKTASRQPAAMKPIKEAMNKSTLVSHIAEHTGLATRDVRAVLASLESTVHASMSKKGVGHFTMPGMFKITATEVPAKPARKGINPFTKEEVMFKARPKSTKVKVRPLKALRESCSM